jgi:hypothetical protein
MDGDGSGVFIIAKVLVGHFKELIYYVVRRR